MLGSAAQHIGNAQHNTVQEGVNKRFWIQVTIPHSIAECGGLSCQMSCGMEWGTGLHHQVAGTPSSHSLSNRCLGTPKIRLITRATCIFSIRSTWGGILTSVELIGQSGVQEIQGSFLTPLPPEPPGCLPPSFLDPFRQQQNPTLDRKLHLRKQKLPHGNQ